jgi:hypothetical protein
LLRQRRRCRAESKRGRGAACCTRFSTGKGLATLIAEVLAFVAVVALSIAPWTIVPLLRGALMWNPPKIWSAKAQKTDRFSA